MTTRTDGPDWFHANAPGDEPVRPVHPFFWAGYLLVDTGVEPPAPAAQAAK